jgi:superfamily II DNA or RNA helicase
MCGDGYVYNIEVQDNNNYFANGYLVHNCHHSTSDTYMKIYDHFKFRQHIGVTATPNRHDKTGLENVYSKIIFERSLKWAIQKGFLTNIDCLRVDIKYDLSQVSTRLGDFAQNELAEAMDETAEAIADVYKTKARGQTLIFATSVKHAYDIAEHIDGAIVVEANTQNRADIIERFTRREIPCLINCMIFTEGTDIPLIETIIIARPTQNVSLYTQMVGRGLRLYEGKEKLLLIDCVGVTRTNNLCTAPSLIGLSIRELQKAQQDEIQGDLFDLEDLIVKKSDNVKNWILNAKFVDIWAKEQSYNTHDMNLFKLPNGDMICQLPERVKFTIPAPNELGITVLGGQQVPMQEALDRLYNRLRNDYQEQKYVWDKQVALKSWGKAPASEKQMKIIQKRVKGEKIEQLTKFEASLILNRLYA